MIVFEWFFEKHYVIEEHLKDLDDHEVLQTIVLV